MFRGWFGSICALGPYGLRVAPHVVPYRAHTGMCKKKAPPVDTATQLGALLKAIKGPIIGDFFAIK